jgi:hypothetical protein
MDMSEQTGMQDIAIRNKDIYLALGGVHPECIEHVELAAVAYQRKSGHSADSQCSQPWMQ